MSFRALKTLSLLTAALLAACGSGLPPGDGSGGAGGGAGTTMGTGGSGATGSGGRPTPGTGGGWTAGTGGRWTTGTGGGAGTAGPAPCETGALRCTASGRRERCTAGAIWADDSYVCTVALSGSSDYNTMCALKADGRIGCWATGDWGNAQAAMMVTRAPAATWKQISVGDGAFEICAIDTMGTVACWTSTSERPPAPSRSQSFISYSFSDDGSCGITETGMVSCLYLPLPSDFTGRFKQIAVANYMLYGIDENDELHAPSFVRPSYPAGKYKQIIANNGASCALRDDGAIFCFPVDGMLPPPSGTGFTEVATTYGGYNGCAIRGDGTLACWVGSDNFLVRALETPPTGTFTHIAGCDYFMCGIRSDGSTVCWGTPGMGRLVPPAGW